MTTESDLRPSLLKRIRLPARGLTVRVGLTGMDQAVSSIGNFAVGVAVARVAGAAALGEYSLTYAMWLIVAAMHRALITDPMAIENDLHHADAAFHMRVGLAAEFALGSAAAAIFGLVGLVLFSVGQHDFGVAFAIFAPFLPFLLAQDYWRWMGFMKAKPAKSLLNDTLFDVVQALVFILLVLIGTRSSVLAILAWGVGSIAAALFGLWQFSVRPSLRGGIERLRLRWSISKWLVGYSAVGLGGAQGVTALIAGIIGPVGFGGLKAATNLVSGPSAVLVQAGGSIGLPEAARAIQDRGWLGLRRVQRFVNLAGIASTAPFSILVLLFAGRLLTLVYGHEFARFALTADILAVTYLVSAFRLGATLALKTSKQMRMLYRASIVDLVASVVVTAVLTPMFGILGAAEAQLASTSIVTATQLVLHWRNSPKAADEMWELGKSGIRETGSALQDLVALASGDASCFDEPPATHVAPIDRRSERVKDS